MTVSGTTIRKYIDNKLFPYLLILPTILCLLGIMIYPLLMGFWVSLTDKSLLPAQTILFVGLNNYIKLVHDPVFWQAFGNTAIWSFSGTAGVTILGLVLALLLNRSLHGRDVFRSLFLLPWAVPYVSVGILWRWMYKDLYGNLDQLLIGLGLTSGPVGFLSNPRVALYSVIVTMVWRHYPFSMLVILGALQGINDDLYEAAEIDGANSLQRFRFITIPGISSALVIAVLLQFMWIFNHFDIVYIMTRGGPARMTELLSTYAYEASFTNFTVGYGSAIGSFIFLVLVITMLGYLRLTERDSRY